MIYRNYRSKKQILKDEEKVVLEYVGFNRRHNKQVLYFLSTDAILSTIQNIINFLMEDIYLSLIGNCKIFGF